MSGPWSSQTGLSTANTLKLSSTITDTRKLQKWFSGGIANKKMCWSGDSTTLNLTSFTSPGLNADGSSGLAQVLFPQLRDVTVYCRGSNGATIASFLAGSLAAGYNLNDIIALNCDLYILCWGINDCRTTDPTTGYTAANLQANLQTAIDTIKASLPNACIILRMPNGHQTGSASITGSATALNCMQRYQTAYRNLRDYNPDVVVWDSMSSLWTDQPLAAGSASPLYNADGLHPGSVAYQMTLRHILRMTVPAVNYRDQDWQNEGSYLNALSYDQTSSQVSWHPEIDPLILEGGDFYKVFSIAGGSEGQNYYDLSFCNYTSRLAGSPVPGRFAFGAQAVTSITEANPGVVTLNGHSIPNGTAVELITTGTLPTNLAINTKYYVVNAAANTFNLSLTSGGAAINTTGAIQSGTHSIGIYGAIAPAFVPGDIVSWTDKKNQMHTYVVNVAPSALQAPSNGTLRWFNSPYHPSARPKAVTFTNGSSVITWSTHDLNVGDKMQLATSGALPTNFATSTVYYVVAADQSAGTFSLSATSGGTAISAGSAGTGNHAAILSSTQYGYVYRHKYAFCDDLHAALNLFSPAPTFEAAVSSNVNPYAVKRRFYITAATATSVTIRALEEGNGNITNTAVYDYNANKANVRMFIPGVSGPANLSEYGISLAGATLTYDTSADTIAITGLTGIDCRNAVIPQGYLTSPG